MTADHAVLVASAQRLMGGRIVAEIVATTYEEVRQRFLAAAAAEFGHLPPGRKLREAIAALDEMLAAARRRLGERLDADRRTEVERSLDWLGRLRAELVGIAAKSRRSDG